jgi:hypothetical protein
MGVATDGARGAGAPVAVDRGGHRWGSGCRCEGGGGLVAASTRNRRRRRGRHWGYDSSVIERSVVAAVRP